MSRSDSMFLFEIAVEHIKSFIKCKDFNIRARFSDVFMLQLKDPNKVIQEVFKKSKKSFKTWPEKFTMPAKSVLVGIEIETLLSKMETKPMELCVFSSKDPCALGIIEIPWTFIHTEYVKNLLNNENPPPATLTDSYKAYDEITSKRLANITLRIKLSQLTGKVPIRRNTVQSNLGPAWNTLLNTENLDDETITGKTVYIGKKRKRKDQSSKLNNKIKTESEIPQENVALTVSEPPAKATEGFHPPTVVIASDVHYGHTKTANTEDTIGDCCTLLSRTEPYYNQCSPIENISSFDNICSINSNKCRRLTSFIRSVTELESTKSVPVSKHWSTTSLEIKQRMDTLNYIFGNVDGPFGTQVYCVGYCTVKTDNSSDTKSVVQTQSPTSQGEKSQASNKEYKFQPCGEACKEQGVGSKNPCVDETCEADLSKKKLYEMDICGPNCRYSKMSNPCWEKICKLDIPADAGPKVQALKCDNVIECEGIHRPMVMDDPHLPTLIKLDNSSVKECCIKQQVVGNVSAKMTHGDDPCLCTCDCTFGLFTQTTYCGICGGYEVPGDEVVANRGGSRLFPCPIYHNLPTKKGEPASDRASRKRPGSGADNKSQESGKETKKKVDERFKFNYGYKAPLIGHSNCVSPCTGDYSNVPKYMGWLWTADNIPGLKRRPGWRPGAANKHVVRLLRIARYPDTALSKRKRANEKRIKRDTKRPLLVVEKKDGEYFVNLETMKQYNKPRLINQPAFEDKDPIVYTVGRSDEENRARAKRRARAQRRLVLEQRAFLQSAFHDMCKEICLKTYRQALAMLPFAEDPLCSCYPIEPPPDRIDKSHSCSCSDSEISGSATDEDEWIIEFTPPNAYYNPEDKSKRIYRNDMESQYNYLDYRVNLIDRFGNPVPRFFIGPTGKTECSDLGGFWGPDKKWLTINEDGVVGPDGRWAPNSFIGPCGDIVEAEMGKFEASNGVSLLVGVDGFVDNQGKWRFYPKGRKPREDPKAKNKSPVQMNVAAWLSAGGCKGKVIMQKKKQNTNFKKEVYGVHNVRSENTWSCLGTASVKDLTKRGIVGHGRDRKLLLEKMAAEGKDVKIPPIHSLPKKALPQKPKIGNAPPKKEHKESLGIAAVSDHGRKTYLKMRNSHTPRLKQRLKVLDDEGISLSSYHVPCFRSFLSTEEERKLITQHILKHNARVMADMGTQIG